MGGKDSGVAATDNIFAGEYDIEYFDEEGFKRRRCERCGAFFWTTDENRTNCGDAPCDIYSFIGSPVFRERSVDEIRESFLSFFERNSHKRLKRYPVVARWRDDIYLTIASIANFQPFVTSGRVPPPANPLVISQPCIRLEDLESIGRTGRHLTIFEMMGHHAFNKRGVEEIYWKDETVRYCAEFLRELGADINAVTFKEAPWMGGGNAGPCLEVITGGLEVATLVFMDLEASADGEIVLDGLRYRKMPTYIVDTGYGLERFVWASRGTPTVYDAVFPEVISEILSAAGMEHPLEKYPQTTIECAKMLGVMRVDEMRDLSEDFIRDFTKMTTVYALADHAKCLAFMLSDGVVPSNAKEGYLARLIIRRAFRMMNALGIELPLDEIVISHIKHLRSAFPELEHAVDRISEILELERRRYDETLSKGARIVQRLVRDYVRRGVSRIPADVLIELYDTHGLPPEFVRDIVLQHEQKAVQVEIPGDFYSIVARMHSTEQRAVRGEAKEALKLHAEKLKRIRGMPKTRKIFYEKPEDSEFEASVVDAFDGFIILDKTLFYPEGGGQPADRGFILLSSGEKLRVVDVQDVDGVVLHRTDMRDTGDIRGMKVRGFIDRERRIAHMRHHTATHIVLCAARRILGDHIWQAGAQKGERRARIDVTHFKRISTDERRRIEILANEMVMRNLRVHARFEERNAAEQKYGFRIYQGGVPDGAEIRIVSIADGEDVQACAGTHCSRTGDVGCIKITRTERIQDGIERIEFAAGTAAIFEIQSAEELLDRSASVLRVPHEHLPTAVERFFEEWKALKKENERLRSEIADMRIASLRDKAQQIAGANVVADKIQNAEQKELMKIANTLSKEGIIAVLIGIKHNRASVVCAVPKEFRRRVSADKLVKRICEIIGGGGGGSEELAQGGGDKVAYVDKAIEECISLINTLLSHQHT